MTGIFGQSKVALTPDGEPVRNPWLGHHREAQYDAFREASRPLAEALAVEPVNPLPPITFHEKAVRRWFVRSRSRPPFEHCVQLLDNDRVICSCEAAAFDQDCGHRDIIVALIDTGIREVNPKGE